MKLEGIAGLTPLQQQVAPLRNKVIAALRGAIETGALAPGTRLVEKDLCKQLGVSRTSLREALRELEAEGVVEISASRGLSVRSVTPMDVDSAYRIRAAVEAMVVEQFVVDASEEDVTRLTEAAEELKAAYRTESVAQMVTAKRGFYERLCAGAGNTLAFDIINRLALLTASVRAHQLLRKGRRERSIVEIDAIVSAIQRRDIAAARKAATEHVSQLVNGHSQTD